MTQTSITPRVAVIGLGNVLLGDDGFGPFTVEVFRSQYECGPEIEVIDLGTPGLDLAPYLYGKELVLIIDAVHAEGEPGTVRNYRETDFLACQAQLHLTDHDPGLTQCLAQLSLTGRGPSEVIVVGVIPKSCALGAGINPIIFAAASVATDNVMQLLVNRGFNCRRRPYLVQPRLWWAPPGALLPSAKVVSSESDSGVDGRHA